MFEGMLHFSDSEDEDEAKFQLQTHGFTSSIEGTVNADGTNVFEGSGNKGIVGEQEGNVSSLTNGDADRRRLIDEFYSQDGLMHFLDSDGEEDPEDKGKAFFEKEAKVGVDKEETKVMTRTEHKKAGIAPPPASEAPYPTDRRARSLSPKLMSSKSTLTTSSHKTPKAPLSTQVAHQAPSPKPASTKTFASVALTPNAPSVTKPQQAGTMAPTPTKPLQTKTEAKKTPPGEGKQAPKKGPNQFKGKGDTSKKQVSMSQKVVAKVNKQIAIKAKQADKSDSPKMKKPFDEVTKPTKTTERIVETPDGKSYQLLSEEEKTKVDRAKKFELMGLLHFSDDEEDELSLETITSSKSKGLNKSQGSQKSIAKPSPRKPNNQMKRTDSKQAKENKLTPFHKDLLSSAGGLATPAVKGSNVGGWTLQGSGKRTPNVCQQFAPKALGNMLHLRNPTPPNSDSDSGSAGGNKSNRHAALQNNEEEEVSDATADVLPIEEIPESIHEGAVLAHPDSNETPDNIQVEVSEPVVEGGIAPQVEDPQPDGIVSSKDADFIKAESE